LRYLQTLVEIGAEHNTTIVFARRIDLIPSMTQVLNGSNKTGATAFRERSALVGTGNGEMSWTPNE
jgi:hypothetical protein